MNTYINKLYLRVSFEWSAHPSLASALAGSPSLPTALANWAQSSESPFQIGEVPPEVAQYLQASTCTVMLSFDTFQKQQNHHPEISPEFYALVPVIFREGEAFEQDSPAKAQFIWQAGPYGFEATVKRTIRGEIFLVSFFRAKRTRIEKTRQKFRRVKESEGTC